MKVDLNLDGTEIASDDFASLKAALIAAQAATPTARASRRRAAERGQRDALEELFAGDASTHATAPILDHRFAPTSPLTGDVDPASKVQRSG